MLLSYLYGFVQSPHPIFYPLHPCPEEEKKNAKTSAYAKLQKETLNGKKVQRAGKKKRAKKKLDTGSRAREKKRDRGSSVAIS